MISHSPLSRPRDWLPLLGSRMPRTMSLLACSNASARFPVRILFFGQSITRQDWYRMVERELRARFPYADLEVRNTGISGFSAPQLNRTLSHCVYPYCPDLVIFHVYGGKDTGEWERIIDDIRRHTSAEILLTTDHINRRDDPQEQEALMREGDHSSDVTRFVAQKYNCELVEVREEWKHYILENAMSPGTLLKDGVHLNDRGCELMARLVLDHFRFSPYTPAGWAETVRSYEAKRACDDPNHAPGGITFPQSGWRKIGDAAVGERPDAPLELEFDGYRVDLILEKRTPPDNPGKISQTESGTADILIDGLPPSAYPCLYAYTLPTPGHGVDWQPAIRRVSFREKPLLEEWILRITDLNEDASRFSFSLYGSRTGPDGSGQFDASKYTFSKFGNIDDYLGDKPFPDVFVSDSGRIVIDHRDFKITFAQRYSGKKCPEGFEIRWETIPMHVDSIQSGMEQENGRLDRVILASGLAPGRHRLTLTPRGDGPIRVSCVEVHRPALRA